MNRTRLTFKNVGFGFFLQVLYMVLSFLERTIFINCFSADYLGLNGLFVNILTIISFAQSGLEATICYCLFKPIKEKAWNKVFTIISLYKKVYNTLAVLSIVFGLLLMPFIKYLIKADAYLFKENIYTVFLLFVLNTVINYSFAYNRVVLFADQKSYKLNIFDKSVYVIKIVVETAVLVFLRNYYCYLIVALIVTLLSNLFLCKYIKKKYYNYIQNENIQEINKKEILSNIKHSVLYRIGTASVNGTDNIIITKILNIGLVGILSNYSLIISGIMSVFQKMLTPFTAGFGSLCFETERKKMKMRFKQFTYICIWMYGFACSGVFVLASDFINMWLKESYVIDNATLLAFVISTYIFNSGYSVYSLRILSGDFNSYKFVPFAEALLNIVLSVFLGKYLGAAGIFIATGISYILTIGVFNPIVVYKKYFKERPVEYYLINSYGILLFLVNAFVCKFIINFICFNNTIVDFCISVFLFCIISNLMYISGLLLFKDFRSGFKQILKGRW